MGKGENSAGNCGDGKVSESKVLNIFEISEKVLTKQTHKRNGLQEVLDRWQEETKTNLNNSDLENMIISEEEEQITWLFVIPRGENTIYKIFDDDFENNNWGNAEMINIQNADMSLINQIISEFPQALEIYKKKLISNLGDSK